MKPADGRFGMLDALRGACLVSMTAYHALYDIVYILGVPMGWYQGLPGFFWQQSICWCFILLSGACLHFSRRPLRHGAVLLGCGALVTLVTFFFMPEELIQYGVLTLLGLSALLAAAMMPLLDRLPAWAGLVTAGALFFLFRDVPQGALGFGGLRLLELPQALYRWNALAVLGLPGPGFRSSDYFPLVPWFFLYLAGYFLWRLVGDRTRVQAALTPQVPVLSFLGRHSLPIYLAHQVVLWAVLILPRMLLGG